MATSAPRSQKEVSCEEATCVVEREAIRLKPTFSEAHNKLAWLLINSPVQRLRDPKQALLSAAEATRANAEDLVPLGAPPLLSIGPVTGVPPLPLSETKEAMELHPEGDASEWIFLAMSHNGNWARRRRPTGVMRRLSSGWIIMKPNTEELHRLRAEAADVLGIKESSNRLMRL